MGLKILNLVDKHYYKYNMDRTFFHTLYAIERHRAVEEVISTGRGWINYNSRVSVINNIRRLYKDSRGPDLVLVFLKDFDYKGLSELSIPTCIRSNELHCPGLGRVISRSKIDLVICHHRNDMQFHEKNKHMKHIAFRNIPHCVNTNIFKKYDVRKEYDILLTGNTYNEVYPFRHRLKKLIENKWSKTYKCKILDHPGYQPKLAATDRYRILDNFSREINKAKITLTCSSKYKYALTKYMEIPLSNSLLAGDLPNERKEFFSRYMLVLNPKSSDVVIENKLAYYLERDSERQKLVDIGSSLITHDRNLDVYADRFVNIINNFLRKG